MWEQNWVAFLVERGSSNFYPPEKAQTLSGSRVWGHRPPSVSMSVRHRQGECQGPDVCSPPSAWAGACGAWGAQWRRAGDAAGGQGERPAVSRNDSATRLPSACHIQALPSAEDGAEGADVARCQAPACADSQQRPPQGGERFALEREVPST